jgi:hypothetical protein
MITGSEEGRRVSSCRRTVGGVCEACGTPFTGAVTRRYCSKACVYKAYRQRHPERWAERNRANVRRNTERKRAELEAAGVPRRSVGRPRKAPLPA